MNDRISIEIASVPDRDDLVAELWVGDEMFAELRKESGCAHIQIYPRKGNEPWDIRTESLLDAVQTATAKLG